jgi:hypothetical protein
MAAGVITSTLNSTTLSASVICSHQSFPSSNPTILLERTVLSQQPMLQLRSKSLSIRVSIREKDPRLKHFYHQFLLRKNARYLKFAALLSVENVADMSLR